MRLAALPCLLALAAAPSCARDSLAGLDAFAGEWAGTHEILGEGVQHAAGYSVRRDGDSLVWDFQSGFQGGFTGRGVLRRDAAGGGLVETWTDSTMPGQPMDTTGSFDAARGVLTMSGEAPDWTTGAPVGYRHETTLVSPDEWRYVMHQRQADGSWREVMWIVMRRK